MKNLSWKSRPLIFGKKLKPALKSKEPLIDFTTLPSYEYLRHPGKATEALRMDTGEETAEVH